MSEPPRRPAPAADRPRRPAHDPKRLAVVIAAGGILLTAVASWSTNRVDATSEHRLLVQQTKQAAAVLSTAVMVLEAPLTTALSVQSVAGRPGDPGAFTRFMSTYVGPGKGFVSASLWKRQGDRVSRLTTTGVAAALSITTPTGRAYALHAFGREVLSVRQVTAGSQRRIGWALADPRTGFAVYAESAVPADRRAPVPRGSAYSNLDYAIYLGPHATDAALTTTDLDPAALPLHGDTARASIRLGDTSLTLVTTPNEHLGSAQGRWLPLGLLMGGLLLTALAALAARRLARDRNDAEEDASTITALFEQVETLYAQQRELFERLQRALLPHRLPTIPALEVASQYVAGAQGIEIGGDWYSVVPLDDHRFGFVVGDVSGRGVDTVAVMAQARFTVRAYLIDGDGPALALEKCSHQFDIATDGHLTTVITGVGDVRTGEVTIANAGHPQPFLVDGETVPVAAPPGRPLGTGPARYAETTIAMPPGATLFCFTDGLIERRGETIDVGLDRLATTLAGAADRSVDALVAHAVDTLRSPDAADDIAALAIRRTGAP